MAASFGAPASTSTLLSRRTEFSKQQGDIAKSYPGLKYLYNAPTLPDKTYTVQKPTMYELFNFSCKQSKMMFFSRAKYILGFRVAMPSWSDSFVGVTKDKMYFYRQLDDTQSRPDFVFDLEDLYIESVGEYESKPFSFRLNEINGAQLVLACDTQKDYLTWLYVMRNGSKAYSDASRKYFDKKAKIVQRFVRGFLQRKKFRLQKKSTISIQSIWRRHRQQKNYQKTLKTIIVLQAFVRMYLAKRERARLKLEGNIAKYHQKRTYIFKEIVQTEENFVTDLQTTLSIFLNPLRALFRGDDKRSSSSSGEPASPGPAPKTLGTTAGKLTKQQSDLDMSTLEMINKVFSNIEDIVPLHQKFLTMLQGISKDWSELSKVGYAFIQMTNELEVYEKYAINFDDSLAILEKLKKHKIFKDFLDRVTNIPSVKKLDITGFLLAPIQRLPRYVLLLKDLLKKTWNDHPDFYDLQQALTRMQKAVSYLNDAKKKDEGIKRAKSLVQKFREPAQVEEILNANDVMCTYEGPVLAVSGSRTNAGPSSLDGANSQKSWLILFTDQLILTERNNTRKKIVRGKATAYVDTVRFNNPVGITLGEIQEDPVAYEDKKLPFAFIVTTDKLVFKFFAKTEEARNKWISEIQSARKNLVLWNYNIS